MEREGQNTFAATILGVDRYGNARLSASAEEAGIRFGALLRVEAAESGEMLVRYVETFGHSKIGDLVLVPDSHRWLSLSVNKGNAFRALGLKAGGRVRLTLLENGAKPAPDARREGREITPTTPGGTEERRPSPGDLETAALARGAAAGNARRAPPPDGPVRGRNRGRLLRADLGRGG